MITVKQKWEAKQLQCSPMAILVHALWAMALKTCLLRNVCSGVYSTYWITLPNQQVGKKKDPPVKDSTVISCWGKKSLLGHRKNNKTTPKKNWEQWKPTFANNGVAGDRINPQHNLQNNVFQYLHFKHWTPELQVPERQTGFVTQLTACQAALLWAKPSAQLSILEGCASSGILC